MATKSIRVKVDLAAEIIKFLEKRNPPSASAQELSVAGLAPRLHISDGDIVTALEELICERKVRLSIHTVPRAGLGYPARVEFQLVDEDRRGLRGILDESKTAAVIGGTSRP